MIRGRSRGRGRCKEASSALLARIEDLRAQRAMLDGHLVAAYGALHTSIAAQVHEHAEQRARAGLDPIPAAEQVSTAALLVEEVTTATATVPAHAWALTRLGAHPRRYAPLVGRLHAGTVSLTHTTLIAARLAHLADLESWDETTHTHLLEQVTTRVLAPTKDGHQPGHRLIQDRLNRVLAKLRDPDLADARRHAAATQRALHTDLDEDGMGTLRLHAPAEQVIAVADRLEAATRTLRAAGDERTLDQLRADLAITALLTHPFGPCPTHTSNAEARQTSTPDLADVADAVHPGWCGCTPTTPAAHVNIIVPFEVATGTSNAPCELPGHGWVSAEHARAIITAPGSHWTWLGVDTLTGQALHQSTTSYRPTPAMTAQIRALDGHCRAPGCTHPATTCDLDHHTPWPTGATTTTNLGTLHRHHHNLKTAGYWHATRTPDTPDTPDTLDTLAARDHRGLAWRTLTGRTYTTYPKSWTQALHDPDAPEHTPPGPLTHAQHPTPQHPPGWNDPPPF